MYEHVIRREKECRNIINENGSTGKKETRGDVEGCCKQSNDKIINEHSTKCTMIEMACTQVTCLTWNNNPKNKNVTVWSQGGLQLTSLY